MSILYESYARDAIRRLAPARVKDTSYTITIALAAGKGTIVKAEAFDPATGATITKAAKGQQFSIYVSIKNDGDKDTIWCTGKDADTGTIIKNAEGVSFDFSTVLDAGKTWGITFPKVVMPDKTFKILIEAGHGV
jgi:hypothetical protein